MSDNNSLLVLNTETEVVKGMEIKFDTQDIITYKIAKQEEVYEQELDELEKSTGKLNKSIAEDSSKSDKMLRDALDIERKKYQESIPKKVLAILPNAKRKKDAHKNIEVNVTHHQDGDMHFLEVSVGHYGGISLGKIPFKVPSKISVITTRMRNTIKERDEIDARISEISAKLANVGKIERKAKAVLIEKMAEQNPKLKSLLG